jgi:hypothetical protein
MHKVYLKPGKEDSLKRFHPWIFSGAIAHFDGEPEEGEVVEVYTSKKEFIAKGHFQIGSIAVRVLSFKQEEINHDFWKHKLEVPTTCDAVLASLPIRLTIPIAWYMEKAIICPDSLSMFMPGLL